MEISEGLKPREPSPTRDPWQDDPPKRSSITRWVWIILAVLLIAGSFAAYRARARAQAAAAQSQNASDAPVVSVSVIPVQKRDVPFYLTGLGSVTAFNTVTVHTRVDGQIMKVNFKEGQFVKEGDLLIEIDPRPYQVALAQAQGLLAKDMASQADAKIDLNRYQQLWQEGVIPRQQLDSQQATVGQFDGSIQGDKAQIDNAKLQLTYSRITSPISGRVGLRLVDAGNIVHATDAGGMLVITQVQPISVIFTLPEDSIPQVTREIRSTSLTVEAYSRDNNTKLAEGKLQTMDNQIDQTTGTVKLKSVFENRDLSLWPNQFVNIRLFLSVKKDALVISSAALQRGGQGTFVYVVKPDNTAEVRQVQVDFIEGNSAVIRQGLKAGEQIVVDGQEKLQEGTKVSAHPAASTRTPGGSASQGQNQ
jgi:membrane fusion protein, multidrug efflux system